MGIHSLKPRPVSVGDVPSSTETPLKEVQKRQAARAPTLKTRGKAPVATESANLPPIAQHTEPRTLVRVNSQAVQEALGSKAALLEQIDPQRHAGFYKHASMLLNSQAHDKDFLLNCLISLYRSAPDAAHPSATDPEWVDDQDVLWGDEILFLFESSAQLDKLGNEGKRYFADALEARVGIVRPQSGSLGALEQMWVNATHRIATET